VFAWELIVLGTLIVGLANSYLIAKIAQNIPAVSGEPVERCQEILNDGHLEKEGMIWHKARALSGHGMSL
jgi:hypothetical protein